jgi:regulator of sigma E protease
VQSLIDTVVLTKNELQARYGGSGAGGGASEEDQPVFSGPVGIANTTNEIVEAAGWRSLIELAALLSLSLGVFNVIPFPGLDGGRILFVLIELVRGGKRMSPEREGLVHLIGIAVLLSGAVIVTYFDVARLLS